jgi:hypothetical protein
MAEEDLLSPSAFHSAIKQAIQDLGHSEESLFPNARSFLNCSLTLEGLDAVTPGIARTKWKKVGLQLVSCSIESLHIYFRIFQSIVHRSHKCFITTQVPTQDIKVVYQIVFFPTEKKRFIKLRHVFNAKLTAGVSFQDVKFPLSTGKARLIAKGLVRFIQNPGEFTTPVNPLPPKTRKSSTSSTQRPNPNAQDNNTEDNPPGGTQDQDDESDIDNAGPTFDPTPGTRERPPEISAQNPAPLLASTLQQRANENDSMEIDAPIFYHQHAESHFFIEPRRKPLPTNQVLHVYDQYGQELQPLPSDPNGDEDDGVFQVDIDEEFDEAAEGSLVSTTAPNIGLDEEEGALPHPALSQTTDPLEGAVREVSAFENGDRLLDDIAMGRFLAGDPEDPTGTIGDYDILPPGAEEFITSLPDGDGTAESKTESL